MAIAAPTTVMMRLGIYSLRISAAPRGAVLTDGRRLGTLARAR
jgi:hypothetical protein